MSGMKFRGAEPCGVWGCEVYGGEVHDLSGAVSVREIVECGVWKGVALCIAWDGRCRYGGHGGARGRVFEVWVRGEWLRGCGGVGVRWCGECDAGCWLRRKRCRVCGGAKCGAVESRCRLRRMGLWDVGCGWCRGWAAVRTVKATCGCTVRCAGQGARAVGLCE